MPLTSGPGLNSEEFGDSICPVMVKGGVDEKLYLGRLWAV